MFFDFSVITNAEQIVKFEDFVKDHFIDVVCKSYNKRLTTGFDAKLVADMLIGARENVYDEAIVVSTDADLAPAINYIRNRLGKKVRVVSTIDELFC